MFGAWMLAATMNAILTWWGVSMAIVNRQMQSTAVVDAATVMKVVPVFVAVMVWLIRILIIGSLSYSGERLFGLSAQPQQPRPAANHAAQMHTVSGPTASSLSNASSARPAPKPVMRPETSFSRSEPTYQSLSMSSTMNSKGNSSREPTTVDTRR